uniref:Ankyrin repeat protein n=1 Tax=Clandestinovirus TaxID=2831644 RepID=A0A8F8KPJ4_9VIRU|nr:ankyrin repeat protein [Clandestinovirus]
MSFITTGTIHEIPEDVVCIILKKIDHPHHLSTLTLVHEIWLRIILRIRGSFKDGWVTFVAQYAFPYNVVNRIRLIVSLGCKLYPNDCLHALRTCYSSEFAKYLHDVDPTKCDKDTRIPATSIMEHAVKHGDIDMMEYIANKNQLDMSYYTFMAAEYGRLNVLKMLVAKDLFQRDSWAITVASQNGHYDCAVYAHDNGCIVDDIVLSTSITRGYEDVFDFVLDKVSIKALERGCRLAIQHCRPRMFRKLISKLNPTKEFGNELLESAAKHGTLSIVQLLYGMGYTINKNVCNLRWMYWGMYDDRTVEFLHTYANLCTCGGRASITYPDFFKSQHGPDIL